MNINPIMTYNRQNQVSHKGPITLYNPLGNSITMDPRAIAFVESQLCNYGTRGFQPAGTIKYTYFWHCFEVTKAIFENSSYFYINARKADVLAAIKKAIDLPNGKETIVGEPLPPLLQVLDYIGYSNLYDKLNVDTVEDYLKNFPGTVKVRKYADPRAFPFNCDKMNSSLEIRLKTTGTAAGPCKTRIADILDLSDTEGET